MIRGRTQRWAVHSENSQEDGNDDISETLPYGKIKHQFTNMEYVWLFSLAAAASYFFYCLLFIIGQVWYAFIFLGVGVLYYGVLFYGLYKRNQEWMGIAILPQFVAAAAFFGGGVFFFVEIFTGKSLIYNWYASTYGQDLVRKGYINLAKRNARIVCIFMVCYSFFTFAVHLLSFVFYWFAWKGKEGANRRDSDGSMRASEITDPAPTMAIDPAIPTSALSTDPIVLPRLRTVTEGPIAYPDPTPMRVPRITPTSYRL